MKKILFLSLTLVLANGIYAQKLLTRSGEIKFDDSMPNFIEIVGKSNTVSAILDLSNGNFAANAIIKSFRFKSPLMEEHFNENYVESSKYPNATFKGKILGFDAKKLAALKTLYAVEGDLTVHGVTNKVKAKIYLLQDGAKLVANSDFTIRAQDYKIEIPSLVKEKFAEQIKVSFNFILEAK